MLRQSLRALNPTPNLVHAKPLRTAHRTAFLRLSADGCHMVHWQPVISQCRRGTWGVLEARQLEGWYKASGASSVGCSRGVCNVLQRIVGHLERQLAACLDYTTVTLLIIFLTAAVLTCFMSVMFSLQYARLGNLGCQKQHGQKIEIKQALRGHAVTS